MDKITVTLGEMVNAENALNKLGDTDLAVASSFKLAKILKRVAEELEFMSIQRKKILDKYGKPDADNKYYEIPKDKQSEAIEKLNELMSVAIDIPIERISLSEEKIKLTAKEFLALEPFVTFEEE